MSFAGLPFCSVWRDLAAAWAPRVHATDASLWGRGVVATERPPQDIKALGRRNDRWHFNMEEKEEVTKAQADSLDVETLGPTATCPMKDVGRADHVEVPLDLIGEDCLKLMGQSGSGWNLSQFWRDGLWCG